jgi:iron complex outermembrane receptor protein
MDTQSNEQPRNDQRAHGFVAIAIASVGLSGSLPAAAQELAAASSSDAAPSGFDEILVTARNRSENAQDVPVPISVIGGEQIDRDRAFTVAADRRASCRRRS